MLRIMYLSVFILLLFVLVLPLGCGASIAEFQLSDLQVSPDAVDVTNQAVISVNVTNVGGASGLYTVNCSVHSESQDTDFIRQVTVDPKQTSIVTFVFIPDSVGDYSISVGDLSASLNVTATDPDFGMWKIPYQVAGGQITMVFSIVGTTPVVNIVDYPSTTFDMYVSQTISNGSRDIYIDSDSFIAEPVVIDNIITGIDMEMLLTMREDAVGKLYVGECKGDVDVSSVDNEGVFEMHLGDGLMDTAGSAFMFTPSEGQSILSVGQSFVVPMEVYSTTGNSSNLVIAPGYKINGLSQQCTGEPFSKGDSIAPYVGTGATIVSTGSSLGSYFSGMRSDIQFMTVIQVEPVE